MEEWLGDREGGGCWVDEGEKEPINIKTVKKYHQFNVTLCRKDIDTFLSYNSTQALVFQN